MATQQTVAAAQPLPFAAHIGLDWADQKHFWTMLVDGKKTRGQLDNTPEDIEVWAGELAQRCGGRPVAVALEQSRGAVIAVLSKYAHLAGVYWGRRRQGDKALCCEEVRRGS